MRTSGQYSLSLMLLLGSRRAIRVHAFSPLLGFQSLLARPVQRFPIHSAPTSNDEFLDFHEATPYYKRPSVQWYPGHIAKAERQLQETVRAVDVVLEVRDARIPTATMHPMVPTWCAGKPRIIVMTHVDAVDPAVVREWWRVLRVSDDNIADKQIRNQATQARQERLKYEDSSEEATTTSIVFVNAKEGEGVLGLKKQIIATGAYVHTKREGRGLLPRPMRVGCLGFPNTGKSALINKLLGRRRARTANTPGITRSLQWIRVSGDKKKDAFELLDSPGIIPAVLENQEHAKLLAICNCIGEAAYDTQGIASHMCHLLMHDASLAPSWNQLCMERYRVNPAKLETGEDVLYSVAEASCQGSLQDAARKLLQDVRTGRMGRICLQKPPQSTDKVKEETVVSTMSIEDRDKAIFDAKKGGVELPESAINSVGGTAEVGKGLFDGW